MDSSSTKRLRDLHRRLRGEVRDLAALTEEFEHGSKGLPDLKPVLANVSDPVVVVKQERVMWTNAALGRVLARSTRALEGMALSGLVTTSDGQPVEARTQASTLRFCSGSGSWVSLPATLVPLGPTMFAIVGRDDRDAERLRESAIESAEIKSEFLTNMSHEIRTPMNGIIGIAELLADTALDDDQQDLVDTIRHSGKWLVQLLTDILDLSKLESGHVELDTQPFDLRASMAELRAVYHRLARRDGLRFTLDVDPDVPAHVEGDEGRIRQVVTNLVGNALKFTEQGHVAVSVSMTDDWRLRFEVSDTGPGIAPEVRRRLFRSFVQGDASTNTKHGGTGLGLAISKRLVELMGGEIGVDSWPGRGSRFWFTVVADAVTPARKPMPLQRQPTHALNILCAEDNVVNRKVLGRMLDKLGHRYTLVDDGQQAVKAAAGERFDVILMDCQMPNLDGYGATRRLRAQGHATPIIALTANAMPIGHAASRRAWMSTCPSRSPSRPFARRSSGCPS